MRLLEQIQRDEFQLVSFDDDEVPPYAILSHTWVEDEEVTYQDVVAGTGKDKAGYKKICFAGDQAAADGLKYFWVDTCCINKASSDEVTTAINSMFRWYQRSARCYAYLSDVSVPGDSALVDQDTWKSAFEKSRWFTRGWTLQELLAPETVEFFSEEGRQLGTRSSLESDIHQITGIPAGALRGQRLSDFSVEERMRWSSTRTTARGEDQAYSLLGIFGLYAPLIYGEGEEHAFLRLREAIEQQEAQRAGDTSILHQAFRAFRTFRKEQILYPLKAHGFRVLKIFPAEMGSNLECFIREYDIRRPPKYSALSYVWGDEPEIHPIFINKQKINIRPNLLHALQRLRHDQKPILIWIDSLCINQFDGPERNAQVRRMADIYQSAKRVFVWLGEEDSSSKIAMESIPRVIKPNFHWDDVWWESHEIGAFDKLLTRPWFRRRRIIQEAAFSRRTTITCGTKTIEMVTFTTAVAQVRSKYALILRSEGLLRGTARHTPLANFSDSPATRLLDIIGDVFSKSELVLQMPPVRRLTLEVLVQRATFCEASDGRDTIFALLNLASDANVDSDPEASTIMVANYEDDLLTVFANFVLHCCQSGSLDVICRPWAPVPTSKMPPIDRVDPSLQSYVPSWISSKENLPFGRRSGLVTARLNADTLVERAYAAHYYTKPQVRLGRYEATASCNGSLHCKGIAIGVITQRSNRMAEGVITQECLDILRLGTMQSAGGGTDNIWRTLCADRAIRGKPAPAEYRSALDELLQPNYTNINYRPIEPVTSIDPDDLLDMGLPQNVKSFVQAIQVAVWNRRTFMAEKSSPGGGTMVGLIPRNAIPQDTLCVLYGCSVPVVLRRYLFDNGHCWELIGEAYVHGYMDGEAISLLSSAELTAAEREFEIR